MILFWIKNAMKATILNDVLKEARRMLPRHPQYQYYPHFTFLFQNNQLIAKSTNTEHEPPKHLGYHARIKSKPKMHSEFNSYKKAKRRLSDEPFVCVNIRLNKKGEIKFAKPCICCYNVLKALGCKYFLCSQEDGTWLKVI